ncbi:MAG: Na/Pi cotransporter family protein [Oscillospiraceae bacterium]|nr:Na/Pi cotransporter family protein [Oscillospiraceae bacterium]
MDIFDGLTLIGGLALFLFGMNLMGSALEKRAGGKLKALLQNVSSNPFKGLFLGIAITALMQSSSVTTVMVVGFVNSGLMTLSQSVPIIMGANLGASITPWILSLSGVSGGGFILQLLKPSSFTPVLALIGVIFHNFSKSTRRRQTGLILLGFAVLMYGMEIMSGAVADLRTDPGFTGLITLISNPVVGVLVGVLVTAVIQSSSASIGILQALSTTGAISYNVAVPVIMGQNIGTCISALLSCLGASKNAKRAALVHLLFNVFSMLILLPLYFIIYNIAGLTFGDEAVNPVTIAIVNTVYKIISIVVLMPMSGLLEKLSTVIVRDGADMSLLDERLLNTPSVAIEQCQVVARDMAELAVHGVRSSIGLLTSWDAKTAQEVLDEENKVDYYEDQLGSYLVKLSSRSLLRHDAMEVTKLLHLISDFERISDHSVNILKSAEEKQEKGLDFSENARRELEVVLSALEELLGLTLKTFEEGSQEAASSVEPLEQIINSLSEEVRTAHIQRLQNGSCTIEMGFILTDLLNNVSRVAAHCSNIAGCVVEMSHEDMDLHQYLHSVRHGGGDYDRQYEEFSYKYRLPDTI